MSRTTSIRPTLRLAVVGALASLALSGCEISLQTGTAEEETTSAAAEQTTPGHRGLGSRAAAGAGHRAAPRW